MAHTNFCDIGFALDAAGERLVVVSCLDNLGKGAAGQAVQNMNGMMGFRGGGGSAMRMVVKIAGALLDDAEAVRSLARQIAQLAQQGHELLVVHGGGKIFTATLERMGIESRFVNGLRVTDRETRDVAVMVLGGLLNKRMAGAISAAGQPAIGLVRVRCGLLSGRADDARRGVRLAGVRRLSDGREPRISGIAVAERDRAGGVVPGSGRGRRDLQHQCRPHGGGLRGIRSRRPADLHDRRCRRAGRNEGA